MYYIVVVVVVVVRLSSSVSSSEAHYIEKTGDYIGDLYWLPIGYWPYELRLVQINDALQLPARDHCTVIWVLHSVGGALYYRSYAVKCYNCTT